VNVVYLYYIHCTVLYEVWVVVYCRRSCSCNHLQYYMHYAQYRLKISRRRDNIMCEKVHTEIDLSRKVDYSCNPVYNEYYKLFTLCKQKFIWNGHFFFYLINYQTGLLAIIVFTIICFSNYKSYCSILWNVCLFIVETSFRNPD